MSICPNCTGKGQVMSSNAHLKAGPVSVRIPGEDLVTRSPDDLDALPRKDGALLPPAPGTVRRRGTCHHPWATSVQMNKSAGYYFSEYTETSAQKQNARERELSDGKVLERQKAKNVLKMLERERAKLALPTVGESVREPKENSHKRNQLLAAFLLSTQISPPRLKLNMHQSHPPTPRALSYPYRITTGVVKEFVDISRGFSPRERHEKNAQNAIGAPCANHYAQVLTTLKTDDRRAEGEGAEYPASKRTGSPEPSSPTPPS